MAEVESKRKNLIGADAAAVAGSALVNPYIFKLEQKPKAILSHDIGAGSPCLKCGNECAGLDLHFWRKVCKNCYCRLDEHDIILSRAQDHGEFVIRKLFESNYKDNAKYRILSKLDDTKPNYSTNSDSSNQATISTLNKTYMNADFNNDNNENETDEFPSDGIVEKLRRIHLGAAAAASNFSIIQRYPNQFYDKQFNDSKNDDFQIKNKNEINYDTIDSSTNTVNHNTAFSQSKINETNPLVEYAWIPAGEHVIVERYMNSLPITERPIIGTQGAQTRRQRLAYQLPYHDCDASAAKSLRNDAERESHLKFVDYVKENVVGIGEIVDSKVYKQDICHKIVNNNGNNNNEKTKYTNEFVLNCKSCEKQFNSKDVGIVTDHGEPQDIWHTNCFRCDLCHQLLGDLLYFFKDGQYFCGRHYGERIYPRCSGCDELIFSKEYTFAEENSWHVDHFCCFNCDLHLGGHRYITKKEKPYCIDCFMLKFAMSCLSCHNKIAPFESRITHKDFHWHANNICFQCKNCFKVLLNQKFSLRDENIFCSVDCTKSYYKTE